MSTCPAWFPAELFRSAEMGVAVEVMRVAAVFGPLTITLGPVVAGLDAGVYYSRAGCDLVGGMCLWAERTKRDLTIAFAQKDNVEFLLGFFGATIPTPVWLVLAAVKTACERAPCDDDLPGDDNMEPDIDIVPPTFDVAAIRQSLETSSSRSALFNVYSHAYQEASELTYAADPTADLRPWLVVQASADLRLLRALLPSLTFPPLHLSKALFAIEGLANWLEAARGEPLGPWSRSTLRRVLRSSELQLNLPVEAGNGGGNNPDSSGGGGVGAVVAVAAVLGLVAALR